jgi:hypothetical protein
MAAFLERPTLLITVDRGPTGVAESLTEVLAPLGADLVLMVDVGGDVLARGDESGLRSPLCDAIMLAAAARLAAAGTPVLLGVFGVGCDAELTPEEVLGRLADVAAAGGLCGARGLTEVVASRLEECIELVPTEASAQAVRAFRGVRGPVSIRDGRRSFELSTVAALTFYLDVPVTYASVGRLAQAVADTSSLEAAHEALTALGVGTELGLEREVAAAAARAGEARP